MRRFEFSGKDNPFGEFVRFLEDVADRGRNILLGPAIDVYETDDDVTVEVDLPGWQKDNLSLEIVDNILYITGFREAAGTAEKRNYHRRERRLDRIEEAVRLPCDVPADGIRAALNNGVLKVSLAKSAPRQGQKINIE
ncbi:MAG: Hsp20/alpha crystallin family protein [Candidatus Desulforudis sp.]|nr:Hsp20/alpha crystallin family protein [Desulforudis sp.]